MIFIKVQFIYRMTLFILVKKLVFQGWIVFANIKRKFLYKLININNLQKIIIFEFFSWFGLIEEA